MYTYDDFGSVIIYCSRPYKQKKLVHFIHLDQISLIKRKLMCI